MLGRFQDSPFVIERKEYVYWINAAGIIIANLPEPYWYPVYELLAETMKTDELLNSTTTTTATETNQDANFLLEHFDLFLADEKNILTPVTLVVTLFHSIWCHSSANHFYYFIKKFIKERRDELVLTESHFLFICKLIGPFLSKIHLENTNLLIDLAQELYDMIHRVDKLTPHLHYMETICNFFYHLKYRHIGESIKEKIHTLMPDFRDELKTQFKYITSELNQQIQQQQQQQLKPSQSMTVASVKTSNSPPNIKPVIAPQLIKSMIA
jgi:mediator of RNA polymerase II transcription subunit 23